MSEGLYTFDRLRLGAVTALVETGLLGTGPGSGAETLAPTEPKNRALADLTVPVFAAAKVAGLAPPALAQKLAETVRLPQGGLFASVDAAGGFVNFRVDPVRLAVAVLAEVSARGESFGNDPSVGDGARVIVEYSSPNIARKMHVGHLRSTVIGHSLRQIFDALGYDVIADNHLGDWGTQFGMLLAAIDLWKLTPWNDPDPVQSLVDIYAKYNNAIREEETLNERAGDVQLRPAQRKKFTGQTNVQRFNPGTDSERLPLRYQAQSWFQRLESGDVWARETWRTLIDITMTEFERTYARLRVEFTTQHGESYFESMMPALVADALAKGVARIEESGAVSVDFEDKLPSCLLRKSDGATLYQTRDAATCLYRLNEYAPARNIYVVGAEQKLHFQQVFEIVRRLGYSAIADVSVHISFGKVSPPEGGRFSMREGNVVFLNDVLDEAVERARAKVDANIASGRYEIHENEASEIAEILGIGAVIYADLFQGPDRNIVFDWDRMLADEGNTATYIQYTHARCKSILRKAGGAPEIADAALLVEPEEQAVLKQLLRLPHAIREAGEKYLPATIADWTYNMAREFARFYDKCPVLTAETTEVRDARLVLTRSVALGLKRGLALLGIRAPERM